ncbi:hypothetical protein [Undibacterium sp. Ji49W]|uniref:hypothetical protein n=1 Tax=Undibacterium sp. Ji49W TaxID=3413040 RepID=UPI003BF56039
MRNLLAEILDGQGLQLRQWGDTEVPGIPVGATVFALLRKPDSTTPFFGLEKLLTRMRKGSIKTDAEAKIWFVQIWFVHLDLIYTSKNRAPAEMLKYVDAIFEREILIESVRAYVNDLVRKLDPDSISNNVIYKTLTDTSDGTIKLAVIGFLELLTEAGLLSTTDEDVYRQTLLSAAEMKLNFDRQLAPLMPSSDVAQASFTLLIQEEE